MTWHGMLLLKPMIILKKMFQILINLGHSDDETLALQLMENVSFTEVE